MRRRTAQSRCRDHQDAPPKTLSCRPELREELSRYGYVEGQNLLFEF